MGGPPNPKNWFLKNLILIIKKLVQRGGPLPYSKCPLTSVDKLAEQNGHKAELQALRQEANRGDEIHKGYKIIFEILSHGFIEGFLSCI